MNKEEKQIELLKLKYDLSKTLAFSLFTIGVSFGIASVSIQDTFAKISLLIVEIVFFVGASLEVRKISRISKQLEKILEVKK